METGTMTIASGTRVQFYDGDSNQRSRITATALPDGRIRLDYELGSDQELTPVATADPTEAPEPG